MQLALDGSNDIHIDESGQLAMTSGLEQLVRQRIVCRLQTFRGELYLDRGLGVPYFSEVTKKSPNLGQIRDLLLSEVRTIEGVDEVTDSDVEFDAKTRVFYLYFKCKLTDGSLIEVNV